MAQAAEHDPFQGIEDVAGVVGGSFFTAGHGVVEVTGVKRITSENPKNEGATMVIANFTVESWVADPGFPPISAGAERDWIVNLGIPGPKQSMKTKMGLNNCKAFASAALGIPLEAVDSDIMKALTGSAQAAKGVRLSLQVTPTKTKSGTDFSVHKFSEAPSVPTAA